MSEQVYVVTGASGNIGKILTGSLLKAGKKVRVIGRSSSRLQPLIDLGAQAAFGSLDDPEFLTEAFHGAKSVFAMIPPNIAAEDFRKYQGQISDSLVEAIRRSGVKNVVALSSIGAHLPAGTGPIKGLFDFEQKLEKLEGADVLILRPAFFMENLFQGASVIEQTGMNGAALKPDTAPAMIATNDIAEFAADAMLNGKFKGVTAQVLLGPTDVSMLEATKAIGLAIGNPELRYMQFPFENFRQAMASAGASEDVINQYIEMIEWMNSGGSSNLVRTEQSSTKTTIGEFAQRFAAVFKGTVAHAAGNN